MGSVYRYYLDILRGKFQRFQCWLRGVSVQPAIEREGAGLPSAEQLEIIALRDHLRRIKLEMMATLAARQQAEQALDRELRSKDQLMQLKQVVEENSRATLVALQRRIVQPAQERMEELIFSPTMPKLEPMNFDMTIRQRTA